MSVPNEISAAGPYIGNGLQREFPFTFPILDTQHVAVYLNGAIVSDGFSVEPVEGGGGVVVFSDPPPSGHIVMILRNVPITQLTDIQNHTAFLPEVIETMADKLTMICQQLREILSRVVTVPPGVDSTWEELMNLLTRRMRISREIATYKKEHNMAVVQTGRYSEILDKRGAQGSLCGMDADFVKKIFEAIHEESVRQQMELINK